MLLATASMADCGILRAFLRYGLMRSRSQNSVLNSLFGTSMAILTRSGVVLGDFRFQPLDGQFEVEAAEGDQPGRRELQILALEVEQGPVVPCQLLLGRAHTG